MGSMTLGVSGTNVTVTYSSTFESGTITANGTGVPPFDSCQSTINITKAVPVCCTPTATLSYICRGKSGYTGSVKIYNLINCINSNNITKIELELSDGTFSLTSPPNGLNGLSFGTMYPLFNIIGLTHLSIPFNSRSIRCPIEITCYITIFYNNGCPNTYLEAVGYR